MCLLFWRVQFGSPTSGTALERMSTMKKVLDVMSAVYKLAIKDGLISLSENTNHVCPVTGSAESDYTAVLVDPKEALQVLLSMQQRERALTLLVASTGLGFPKLWACNG